MRHKLILIGITLILLVGCIGGGIKFWQLHQINVVIEAYSQSSLLESNTLEIYTAKEWQNGLIVPVRTEDMVGVLYLHEFLGMYKVENLAIISIEDLSGPDFLDIYDYDFKIMRGNDFEKGKDIVMIYGVGDFTTKYLLDDIDDIMVFTLDDGNQIVFGHVNNSFTLIESKTPKLMSISIEWQDKSVQDITVYPSQEMVIESNRPLRMAYIGDMPFKTSLDIEIKHYTLEEIGAVSSEKFDGIFINNPIDNHMLTDLIDKGWATFLVNPSTNLSGYLNQEGNQIILAKGKQMSGKYNNLSFYDRETSYFVAFQMAINNLSDHGSN